MSENFDMYGKSIVEEIRPYLHNSYPFVITKLKMTQSAYQDVDYFIVGLSCTKCDYEFEGRILGRFGRKEEVDNPFHFGMNITRMFYENHIKNGWHE